MPSNTPIAQQREAQFVYNYAQTWFTFAQELIDAYTYELQLLANAFLAERLFPRIGG